jgi:hypothetical protein
MGPILFADMLVAFLLAMQRHTLSVLPGPREVVRRAGPAGILPAAGRANISTLEAAA